MRFLKKKKKVGLVLGSGGARGMAHIGVIKTLLKHNIPIDIVVGSSFGALVGGLFASWGRVDDLEKLAREVTYKDVAEVLVDPTWGGGLIKGTKTLVFLRKLFGNGKIEELKIPFAAVATDVNTAESVIFSKGDVASAIRASISVPLMYSPVLYGSRLLVDGGVSSPVPVEVAREMGAELIVAVNLDGVYFSEKNRKGVSKSSTIDVLKDSYYALRYNLAKKEVFGADVLIEPEMRYVKDFDFINGKEAIVEGERATEKVIGEIKKLI